MIKLIVIWSQWLISNNKLFVCFRNSKVKDECLSVREIFNVFFLFWSTQTTYGFPKAEKINGKPCLHCAILVTSHFDVSVWFADNWCCWYGIWLSCNKRILPGIRTWMVAYAGWWLLWKINVTMKIFIDQLMKASSRISLKIFFCNLSSVICS